MTRLLFTGRPGDRYGSVLSNHSSGESSTTGLVIYAVVEPGLGVAMCQSQGWPCDWHRTHPTTTSDKILWG